MKKKEFVSTILDLEHETFVVYVVSLSSTLLVINVHPFCKSQIAGLIAKKVLIKVFVKYANFADIFSLDFTPKLFKYTKINNHAIKLVNG